MSRRHRFLHASATAAAIGGLAVGSVTWGGAPAAALTPTTPAYGEIVVTDGDAIRIFAPDANGDVAPVRTITGPQTGLGLLFGVALDRSGDIWVMDYGHNRIAEFAPDADGNVAPIRVLEPSSDISSPEGLALSRDEGLAWVSNFNSGTVSAFDASANGPVAPTKRITGSNTGMSYANDLAFAPDGDHVWVTDSGYNLVHEYSTSGVENQAPTRTLDLAGHEPQGVAAERFGAVWVSDSDADALDGYGPASDTTPARTIAGASTGLDDPRFVSFDAAGRLWVANLGGASVEAFAPSASGDAAPVRRITGPNTHLATPRDVAVFGAKPTVPTAVAAAAGTRKVKVSWQAPTSTGGGLLGYVVRRKNSKTASWKNIAWVTSGTRCVDRDVRAGHRYRYDVIAANEVGSSPASATVSAVPHT